MSTEARTEEPTIRISHAFEGSGTNSGGDAQVGGQWVSVYLTPDHKRCIEVVRYVEYNMDLAAAEERAEETDVDGNKVVRYGVTEMITDGEAICEDGSWRPDDSAEIDYTHSYHDYETVAEAEEVRDGGIEDESWKIMGPTEFRAWADEMKEKASQ